MTDGEIRVPRARAPRILAVVGVTSALLAVLPAAFAVHYTRGFLEVRRGKDVMAQRETLTGVTWFQPSFHDLVDRLQRTLPADAHVLIEPGRIRSTRSTARWHLFLNHYAYPLRFHTRQPAWASGTLVDYPRWLEHHARPLSLSERLEDERAMNERGIGWVLRVPIADRLSIDEVELYELTDEGPRRIALAPSRRARSEQTERDVLHGEGEHGIDEGGL